MDEPNKIFTGEVLKEAVATVHPERPFIINNFLYEKSAMMLYADDGVGKSVICLQACLQMTLAESKFLGEFEITKARNIIYFQMERHPDESFERMRHMQTIIPYDPSNLCISVELQGIDLMDKASSALAYNNVIKTIKAFGKAPDVMAFDPIYSMVSGDLSNSETCNAVTGFFRKIQSNVPCTIFATSHTNRGMRDPENKGQRMGKDMYGNRFLSAFFTGSYHLESKADGAGATFKRDKNSQKNLEKKFGTNYDPATYCSWSDAEGKMTKKEKLYSFLRACKASDKEFSFQDMQEASLLSDSPLRGYLTGELKNLLTETRKLGKGKQLYKFLG